MSSILSPRIIQGLLVVASVATGGIAFLCLCIAAGPVLPILQAWALSGLVLVVAIALVMLWRLARKTDAVALGALSIGALALTGTLWLSPRSTKR